MTTSSSTLSSAIGWTYFFAWSLSFYPQVIQNYRRQSVLGLSLDFVYLNLWGFLCYTIFNLAFYLSPLIQKQFQDSYGQSGEGLVEANDVAFALHALFICAVTVYQTKLYGNHMLHFLPFLEEGSQHRKSLIVSPWVKQFIAISLFGVIVLAVDIWLGHAWELDLIYYFSVVKMAVTLIKYTPQAVLNYQLKSTVGWSIGNILLDLTGGILSATQLFLDKGVDGITGNPVKFGLGIVSILFDFLFITQHYILYPRNGASTGSHRRQRSEHDEERTPLLCI